MASFHCSVKVGAKGKAAAHSDYISREGKYVGASKYEDLESKGVGNMPEWAEKNSAHFWNSADEFERANGATYREIEVALPRELDPAQRRALVEEFVNQELGDKHAYQWAIHKPKAALEKGDQPHAHIMYSERTLDGIQRDPAQYFKRYNAKNPEKGGCRKDSAGTEERLLATREAWAKIQNAHLERHGHAVRVDHRSLKDQGIDRVPEKHLGGAGVRRLDHLDIAGLLRRRAAEGELERAKQDVGLLDLSGDLRAARADRDRQQKAEVKAEAPRPTLDLAKLEAGLSGVRQKMAARELERQRELTRQTERTRQMEREKRAELDKQREAESQERIKAALVKQALREQAKEPERKPEAPEKTPDRGRGR